MMLALGEGQLVVTVVGLVSPRNVVVSMSMCHILTLSMCGSGVKFAGEISSKNSLVSLLDSVKTNPITNPANLCNDCHCILEEDSIATHSSPV
jgi:hypothetical protein